MCTLKNKRFKSTARVLPFLIYHFGWIFSIFRWLIQFLSVRLCKDIENTESLWHSFQIFFKRLHSSGSILNLVSCGVCDYIIILSFSTFIFLLFFANRITIFHDPIFTFFGFFASFLNFVHIFFHQVNADPNRICCFCAISWRWFSLTSVWRVKLLEFFTKGIFPPRQSLIQYISYDCRFLLLFIQKYLNVLVHIDFS